MGDGLGSGATGLTTITTGDGLGEGGQKSGEKMQFGVGESIGVGVGVGVGVGHRAVRHLTTAAGVAEVAAETVFVPPTSAVVERRQAAAAIAARSRLPRRAAGSLGGATGTLQYTAAAGAQRTRVWSAEGSSGSQ